MIADVTASALSFECAPIRFVAMAHPLPVSEPTASLGLALCIVVLSSPGDVGILQVACYRRARKRIVVGTLGIEAASLLDSSTESVLLLPQDSSFDDLLLAVRSVLGGSTRIKERAARESTLAPPDALERVRALTRPECEVARLLTQGLTSRAIAKSLQVSIATVKNHVHQILGKLEVPNRTTLTARYGAVLAAFAFDAPPTTVDSLGR